MLIPVIAACGYWLATSVCMSLFCHRGRSLIKPVYGLEKNLYENLRTACLQDYPDYEVIYSFQRADDPALSTVERIQREFSEKKIEIVVDTSAAGPNGRLVNILNGSKKAKGEILVFSDSDMFLEPDYLKTVTAPLANPEVGVSCTLYKAWKSCNIPEALELLSFNADFVPAMVFALVTKASIACPGASQAIRREVLEIIGGLEPLAHYLVEDFELGRRVEKAGFQIYFSPYVANTGVDLKHFKDWWRHQVYWDQNTRAANGTGFFFTLLIRGLPFALLYALFGGAWWPFVLAVTLGIRFATAWANALYLKDWDGLKSTWLLPFRDILGIFVWFASFVKRKTYWKGREFIIQKGRMVEVP
ncbi:MAG: glycosyltransferase [bacterium]|nr:glycosyltransferase [bacterium]